MKEIVIDASVVAKWYLDAEELADCAQQIKTDYFSKQVALFAPFLINYELSNVILSAVRGGRLSARLADTALESFYSLDINLFSSPPLLLDSFKLAKEFNISSYDASYVALCQSAKIPFYTADAKLIGKLQNKIPLVKSLSKYPN